MAYKIEIEIKHTLSDQWIGQEELTDIMTGKYTYADAQKIIRELINEDMVSFLDDVLPDIEINITHVPDVDE